MPLIDHFIEELKYEIPTTRKLLERVPEKDFDWKPHAKSMTMNQLASHIAETFVWVGPIIAQDEMVMDMEQYKPWLAKSTDDLLKSYDAYAAKVMEELQGVSDESLMKTWMLLIDDKPVLQMPRIAALRGFILKHIVHHRGQLTVYLRLRDVPLPQVYGPSADDQGEY